MKRKLTIPVTVLAIVLAFTTPVMVSVLIHSDWVDWRAPATRHHGALIEPVRPVGEFHLPDHRGRMLTPQDLEGRWQLVLIEPGACGEACLERAYWLRQVRLAQDRHHTELGLVLVTGKGLARPVAERLLELAGDFTILDGEAGGALMARFPDAGEGGFYILDPGANIIERFAADADPNGIRKDLRRLLTWTRRN